MKNSGFATVTTWLAVIATAATAIRLLIIELWYQW
jgi:hypothetical protein